MRFEVTKRREETKGILNKRTEYYCVVNLDFTDEELDTLNEACLEKAYAVESVGDLDLVASIKSEFSYTLGDIAKSATKNGGVYSFHIQMYTAEAREVTIDEVKAVAKNIKSRLEILERVKAVGDEDTSEEL